MVKIENQNSSVSILDKPNVVHSLSYIPYGIGAILMYFLWNTDKKKAMIHIKYSAYMAIIIIVLLILLKGFFAALLSLIYLGISWVLAYKAYNGELIQIEILDTLEDKVTHTIGEKIKK